MRSASIRGTSDRGNRNLREAVQVPDRGDAADRGLRVEQPDRRRLRAGIQHGPGQLHRLQAGPDLRLDQRQGRPGGFGWLSWDGSNSATALSDAVCTPSNPALSLDSPYDSPGAFGGFIGTNPSTGETWFPADPGKSNKSTCGPASIAGSAAARQCLYRSTTSRRAMATTRPITSLAWPHSCSHRASSPRWTISRATSCSTTRTRTCPAA